jgi:hypothetical protein
MRAGTDREVLSPRSTLVCERVLSHMNHSRLWSASAKSSTTKDFNKSVRRSRKHNRRHPLTVATLVR